MRQTFGFGHRASKSYGGCTRWRDGNCLTRFEHWVKCPCGLMTSPRNGFGDPDLRWCSHIRTSSSWGGHHQTLGVRAGLSLCSALNMVCTASGLPEDQGLRELQLQVPDLPTGKARFELKWHTLSPAWKQAFQSPIEEALDVYFKYEAIAPVFPQDHIDKSKLLPSRFVLTKKADPKNCSPLDSQIEDAKLKARWEVAGHLDTEAGLWETEAPTASLMAHNLLAFLRRSSGGRCFFWGYQRGLSSRREPGSSTGGLGRDPQGLPGLCATVLGHQASTWSMLGHGADHQGWLWSGRKPTPMVQEIAADSQKHGRSFLASSPFSTRGRSLPCWRVMWMTSA